MITSSDNSNTPNDYQYDVFFSYKHDDQSCDWHKTTKKLIECYLQKKLGRARIFYDDDDITTGAHWESEIKKGLLQSKCIICMWSSDYFESEYCLAELKTFIKREEQFGGELIIPAIIHNFEGVKQAYYDKLGKQIKHQAADFSKYLSLLPKFWDTNGAVEFEQEKIKPFSENLAAKIAVAPVFKVDFPVFDPSASEVPKKPSISRPGKNIDSDKLNPDA